MQTKMSKVWAYGVAYASLALGSGVSIAGNIADTYRISGPATDTLDITLAAFWPAAVLLAIEMFVSTLWSPARGYQALRWIGSIGIGFMAMRVSWIHLNELLASRGQAADVATLGPLAIDGLAIMATALILSGRRTVSTGPTIMSDIGDAVDTLLGTAGGDRLDTVAANLPPLATPSPYGTVDDLADALPAMAMVSWTPPAAVPPLSDDLTDAASFWTPERQATYAAVATGDALPVRTPRRRADRGELVELLTVGHRVGAYRQGEIDTLLATYFEVSTRTIRRARVDAGISPVSAPPAAGVN